MKRELQEKGLDVLCNNAGIMGDLDILVAQPLKHRQDLHPLPSNSSHLYLRWALLSPPQKKLPRKKSMEGKKYVAWRTIAMFWEKIAFSGKNPSTLFKTRSYIRSPRKNETAMNRKCWDFHFPPPPLFWREKIPMGKPSPWHPGIHLHDLSWTQNEKNVNVDSTRLGGGGEENKFRKSEKKQRMNLCVGGNSNIFF